MTNIGENTFGADYIISSLPVYTWAYNIQSYMIFKFFPQHIVVQIKIFQNAD